MLAGAVPVIVGLVAAAFIEVTAAPHLVRQGTPCLCAVAGIADAERLVLGPGEGRIAHAIGLARMRRRGEAVALAVSATMWLSP